MSGMNNPTLHRHAVHGLQGATPSLCLDDLVPFAGPSHGNAGGFRDSEYNKTSHDFTSIIIPKLIHN